MGSTARRAAFVAATFVLAACAPAITRIDLAPRSEASAKEARARVTTFACAWSEARARYRREGGATWVDLPAAGAPGELLTHSWWAAPIAGSEDFLQGQRYEVQWRVPYAGNLPGCGPGEVVAGATFTVGRPFALSATPTAVDLPANTGTSVALQVERLGQFAGTVQVSATNLPPGVAAAPVSIPGATATMTLEAAASAPAGTRTVTLLGTSPGRTTQQATLSMRVTRPALDSVSAAVAARGAVVSLAGAGFAADCAANRVSFGTTTVAPLSCDGTTTLRAQVPDQAPYGAATIAVTAHAVPSNTLPFTVGRVPGAFVDITAAVQGLTTSPRNCPAGTERVEVAPISGPNRSFRATYRRVASGAAIASVDFQKDSPTVDRSGTPESVNNLGGAGFDGCRTGIVLDADARDIGATLMAMHFVRLEDGSRFSKGFDVWTPLIAQQSATIMPRLYRSPDGTVLIVVAASRAAVAEKAIVIDRVDGRSIEVEFEEAIRPFSARITADDRVAMNHGGTDFGPVGIP